MNNGANDPARRPILFTPDGRDASITVREPVEYEIDGKVLKFVQTPDEIYELARKVHDGNGQALPVVPVAAPGTRPDAQGQIQTIPAVIDKVSLAHIGLLWMTLQKAWQEIEVLKGRLDEVDREMGRDIGP